MSLSLRKLKEVVVIALQYNFTTREREQLYFILLEHFTGLTRLNYLTFPDREVSSTQHESIVNSIMLLNKGIPVQHITEKAYFRDLELKVNKHVLLPRPETEELVGLVLDEISPNDRILDAGTGSGCIPLSLKNELPGIDVIGIDISQEALDVAQLNGENLGFSRKSQKSGK